ncbi:MAG: helix-turn-helix transcriptional regulator [Cytophagaceae bacterium]|nr:helix-turn-helix transcriptional regulator [Cytophagaceae bacterium]
MDRLLKNTRIQFGLKLQEISLTTGIDKALLSKFENGSRIPPEKALFPFPMHIGFLKKIKRRICYC